MLSVFEASSAEERIKAGLAFLQAGLPCGRMLIVTPQARAGRALLRTLGQERGIVAGVEVLALHQLAAQLARAVMVSKRLSPIDRAGAQALCGQALEQEAMRQALGPLSIIADCPSFPRTLSRTLAELKAHRVPAAILKKHCPHLEAALLAYGRALAQAGVVDCADLWRVATEQVEQVEALYERILYLDLPLADPAEATFALAAARASRAALLTLPYGDRRTRRYLSRVPMREMPAVPPPVTARARLQRFLFAATAAKGAADETVTILSAADERRECVEIARTLLWEAEAGTSFDRMAVLPRQVAPYRAHLAEALFRAGIPAYFAGAARRPDPAGQAVIALLRCRAEGLSVRRFAEFLSLQVATIRQENNAEPWVAPTVATFGRTADDDAAAIESPAEEAHGPVTCGSVRRPYRWERLLATSAVIAGRHRWRSRLAGLEAELRLQQARAEHVSGQDASAARALKDLTALRQFSEPLLDLLEALPERATLADWLDRVQRLCLRVLRDPAAVLSTLADLRLLSDLGRKDAHLTLDEALRVLTDPLSHVLLRDSEDEAGKVFVANADSARGRCFEVVCIPGLVEDVFPERVREDPLLLDDVRTALHPGLPTSQQRIDDERVHLHIAAGAATRRVCLSYPRTDLDRGRPRVPSFYALEALRAAEGTLPSYDALMRRAEATEPKRPGWPAPQDPWSAIDEAEHDLATLAALLAQARVADGLPGQPPAGLGGARHLLLENPHLARALRTRARRWTVRAYGPADGLVDPGLPAKALLAAHLPATRAYAATALQEFARCPYRFYLRSIVGLYPAPQAAPIEEMHPLHRAALIDECQFRILTRLRAEGLLPLFETALPKALALADEIITDAAQAAKTRLCPGVDRVFDDGVARARADLHAWLTRLPKAAPWVPCHVELTFGIAGRQPADPASRESAVDLACGLRLKGAIDLVERSGAALRVTSHHTGRHIVPKGTCIAGGRSLQPVLYGLAAQALFPQHGAVEGRLYYCTAQGEFEERSVAIDEDAKRAAKYLVRVIDQAISQGFLPAAPSPQGCTGCEYQVVCGPHEMQRTRAKRSPHLAPLLDLRRQR